MKANELRIGNWISTFQEEQAVDVLCDSVSTMTYQCLPYDMVSAIPLTEEWLVRFGFRKHEINNFWFIKGNFVYGLAGYFDLIQGLNKAVRLSSSIKEVHQLQNLYFALTGEELTTQL